MRAAVSWAKKDLEALKSKVLLEKEALNVDLGRLDAEVLKKDKLLFDAANDNTYLRNHLNNLNSDHAREAKDHWRRVEELEQQVGELRRQVEDGDLKLRKANSELEGAISRGEEAGVKAVEAYKASEEFKREIVSMFIPSFDLGWLCYRKALVKQFPGLDLSVLGEAFPQSVPDEVEESGEEGGTELGDGGGDEPKGVAELGPSKVPVRPDVTGDQLFEEGPDHSLLGVLEAEVI